tara:strand:- start:1402 stop:2694 length:1293 start_codon:yes stop_codon:yes gene_type:complete
MKFHHNKNFKYHELWNGHLHLAGDCNIDIDTLGKLFSDHSVPTCTGNFAIVWVGNDGWNFAQTDHLNTYPIWYKEDGSELYSLWSQVENIQRDDVFYAMRDLLYGQMTVGTRTPCQTVKRLQPDHYLDNGTQSRYRWSIEPRSGPPMSDWQDILIDVIDRNTNDGDVLFLSGGRDSTTIANVAHHLGKKLQYVHITRGKENPDTTACKEFAKNIGIEVNYIDPWQKTSTWNEHDYWHDSSYNPKRTCLNKLNSKSGISGELGVSESGSKKINPILQMPNINIEQLTNIWLTTLEARNESVASPLIHTDYTKDHRFYEFYEQAYKELIEYYESHWKHYSEIEDTKYLLKCALMMHQQDHESYRLHNYSQDVIMQWNHPLADYKWYDLIMNCDIKLKGVHYHKRYPYLVASRTWDWFDQTAWNYGGPRGLTQ